MQDDIKQKPPRFRLLSMFVFCIFVLVVSFYGIFKDNNTFVVFLIHVSGLLIKCTLFWSDAYYIYRERKKTTDNGLTSSKSPSFLLTATILGILLVVLGLCGYHIYNKDIVDSYIDTAIICTIFNFFMDFLSGVFKIYRAEANV
ncbi:MAG: hypothetical protein NC131_11235 [Roseburia sp.]|nr:hypothetical protein [Roseburia sp.]